MIRFKTAPLALLIALGGCSALPSAGPSTRDVVSATEDDLTRKYEVIEVDQATIRALGNRGVDSFSRRFGDYRPPVEPVIGVGDFVTVTIWEAGAGGLFSAPLVTDRFSAGSKSAMIPEQAVARDGAISVPYAGRIKVAGQTPAQVQATIEEKLAGRAIQPQILVTVTRPISSSVTVTGEVAAGARVPLSVRGDRLLDVIASAGGIRVPVNETEVRLSRGKVTVSVPLSLVVSNPNENIYLRAGDSLTLVRNPRTFLAVGATGRNTEIPFEFDNVTLAQALAKAGGLLDERADPYGVFLFRLEREELVRTLRPDSPLLGRGRIVPVVYHLNMREPNSLFLAQGLRIQAGDVLYVSNSPLNELRKALQLLSTITSPVIQGVSVSSRLD